MRATVASLGLLAVTALVMTACGTGTPAPGSGAAPAVRAPSMAPAAATPSVSQPAPSRAPTAAESSEVVVRMKWCVDVCLPQEATIVMRDGRVVWNEPDVGVRQGRLAPEGVAWVEDQVDASGLLDEAAAYDAQLRPGAQPAGGGATSFAFSVSSPTGPVRVTAGIPDNPDERFWIVSEELATLVDLGGRMMDADRWVPTDLWLEAAEPYEPREYLLLVTLHPRQAAEAIDPRADVDVDRVPWPVPGSLDVVTPAVPVGGDQRARCAVLDAETARRIDVAQRLSGSPAEPRPPFAGRAYLWERGGGSLTVEFQSLLPDEHDCRHAQLALD